VARGTPKSSPCTVAGFCLSINIPTSAFPPSRQHRHRRRRRRRRRTTRRCPRHDMELSFNINPKNTDLPTSLLQLLSHTLVLYQIAPYLPTSSLLALGAASKAFQTLIHNTPNVFRRLDLTKVRSAQFEIVTAIDHGGEVWRNVQLDENVTEDESVSPYILHESC
jgi:hypothetical protein